MSDFGPADIARIFDVPEELLGVERRPAEDALRALCDRYDDGDDEGRRLYEQALRNLGRRRRRGGKACSRCGEAKPLSAFGPDDRNPDGKDGRCRACSSELRRLSRTTGPLL